MLPSQTGCVSPPSPQTNQDLLSHPHHFRLWQKSISGTSPKTWHSSLFPRGQRRASSSPPSPHLHRDECGHRGSNCHHSCPSGLRRGPKSYFPSVPVIEEYTWDTRFQEEHVLIDEHVWGAGCQEEYRPSQYLESAVGPVHKCRVWRPARPAQELYPGGAG